MKNSPQYTNEDLHITTDAIERWVKFSGLSAVIKALTLVVGCQYEREQHGESSNDLALILDKLIEITEVAEHIEAREGNRGER